MSSPSYKTIAIDDFAVTLGATATEVSSVALGGRALSCSDEWFAPASDLLKVGPALSLKGQFGPAGALFDGWETRRHNPEAYDWAVIRLGPAAGAELTGFDIDTANFNGNEGPEAEVWGLQLPAEEEVNAVKEKDARWFLLLPRVPLGPSSRHIFALEKASACVTHVKLHMIPDGGIARFRAYGQIAAPPLGRGEGESIAAEPPLNSLDLAHVLNGGRVVFTSDQHFGVGSNLLLPGRGKDMGDGWETKRSRTLGHKDWVTICLGEPGFLHHIELDTAHFLGNFPESAEVHATLSSSQSPGENAQWTSVLSRSKLGPGKQHFFKLSESTQVFSHVRITIHPDGGIKRIRIVGRRAAPLTGRDVASLPEVPLPGSLNKDLPSQLAVGTSESKVNSSAKSSSLEVGRSAQRGATVRTIQAQALTSELFAPYGRVIAGPAEGSEQSMPHRLVNQGSALKFPALAGVKSTYSPSVSAELAIHVYRCTPVAELPWHVEVLERHRFTSQAFIPMTPPSSSEEHKGYFVVVAKNGSDDGPDLSTLAAFRCKTTQGVSYDIGTWHAPMKALGRLPTDFAVVHSESEMSPELNCDEVFYSPPVPALIQA